MYYNDNNNAKEKYETLKNANFNNEVMDERTNETMLLEQVLIEVEKGSQSLFLVAE